MNGAGLNEAVVVAKSLQKSMIVKKVFERFLKDPFLPKAVGAHFVHHPI